MQDEIVVSDHAIIRYLERVKGVDVELIKEAEGITTACDYEVICCLKHAHNIDINSIKKEILTDKLKEMISIIGDAKYPIGHGLRAIVRENTIVTIKP